MFLKADMRSNSVAGCIPMKRSIHFLGIQTIDHLILEWVDFATF